MAPQSTLVYTLPTPPGRWLNVQAGDTLTFTSGADDVTEFPYLCPAGVVGGVSGPEQSSPLCKEPCPAGQYCSAATTQPVPCPLGSFCPLGTPAAIVCPLGSYAMSNGLSREDQCRACKPGHWCNAGASNPCPKDTFNSFERQDSQGACSSCPEFSMSPPASTNKSSCKCVEDYYDAGGDPFGLPACQVCPIGANCRGTGNTIEFLPVLPGYWRLSRYATDIRRCPDQRRGNESSCAGGSGNSCIEGTAGPYCRACNTTDSSHYFSPVNSRCVECEAQNIGSIIGIVIAVVVGVAIVVVVVLCFKSHQRAKWLNKVIQQVDIIYQSAQTLYERVEMRGKLKQMITFYQISTRIDVVAQRLSAPVVTSF